MKRKLYLTTLNALILLLILPALACQTLTTPFDPPTPTLAYTSTPIPTNTPQATATPDTQARQEYLNALSSALDTWLTKFNAFSAVDDRISNEGSELFNDEDFKQELVTVLVEMDYAATALEELPEPTPDLVKLDMFVKVIAKNTHIISDDYISALAGEEEPTQNYLDALDNILAALDDLNQEAENLQQ